ncbi:MAG: phage distal tail protein [bacterium]
MGAEVFNSHNTTITLSKLIYKEDTYNLTQSDDIVIDNRGNKEALPIIEIEVNGATSITSISNDERNIIFSLSDLVEDDVLILDFNEQSYTKNGTDIIDDISLDGLLSLIKNQETTFTFTFTGDIDITFKYFQYQEQEELHYVQNFTINENKVYEDKKPFNSNKNNNRKLNNVNYSFNISKMSVEWIDTDNEFRIGYHIKNPDTLLEEWFYLIGVTFNRVNQKGFNNPNEIFKDNISGDAIDLIERNY